MKRSHWIIAFVIVVGGFAGFQQFQSWSLNNPHEGSQAKSEEGPEPADGERTPAGGGGGGGGGSRGGETVPVLVATAVQKSVPLQIRAVGNVEAYTTVA